MDSQSAILLTSGSRDELRMQYDRERVEHEESVSFFDSGKHYLFCFFFLHV